MDTPIVGPSGNEMHRFGGDQAWRTYESGGYNVSLEWHEGEPCAAIWPAVGVIDRGVWVVCLSAIHVMLELNGKPTTVGFEMVRRGIRRMGVEPTWPEVFKVFDIVVTALGDMVRMPPKKRPKKIDSFFEATEYVNGRKHGEREV